MTYPAWITSIVAFVREHPRRAAAAICALVALLIAAWWSGSLRSASTAARVGASREMHRDDARPGAQLHIPWSQQMLASDGPCFDKPVPAPDDKMQAQADLEEKAVEAKAASVLDRFTANLAAGSTDRDRAAGMYLQEVEARHAAGAAWIQAHGTCADTDTACWSDLSEAGVDAVGTVGYQRALAHLATTTSDAEAYALALYSCTAVAGGDCALLSYAQWARLEPDNAVPWLHLAAEAERRHDRSGLDAAMLRASKSRYSDSYTDAISRPFFLSDDYQSQPPLVQFQLAAQVIGIEAAVALPPIQTAALYCKTGANSAASAQICGDLAAVLIEHSGTVMEVFLGGHIAEKVGWVDPRLSGLRDQADALRWQMSKDAESWKERAGCGGLPEFQARVQLGELAFLRRELAGNGVPASEAAEQWRAEVRKRSIASPQPQALER